MGLILENVHTKRKKCSGSGKLPLVERPYSFICIHYYYCPECGRRWRLNPEGNPLPLPNHMVELGEK